MHTIAPIPNINGSHACDLATQMSQTARLLEAVMEHMRLYRPHGRDYQIGGDLKADTAEFERRHKLLSDIAEQYQDEAEAVMRYDR